MTKPVLFWKGFVHDPRIGAGLGLDPNLDGLDALTIVGAERLFEDTITETARNRPELDRVLLELRFGDGVQGRLGLQALLTVHT